MNDIILFGDKMSFAIQLGFTKTEGKYKLCFWFLSRKMGSFTKGDSLSYSIKAYRDFTNRRDEFYFSAFDQMSPTQICKYLIIDLFSLGRSNKKENIDEYEKRKRLQLFFGFQFSNDGSDIILLFKENKIISIYNPPKTTKADSYIIPYIEFQQVFEKYIQYCNDNHLLVPIK